MPEFKEIAGDNSSAIALEIDRCSNRETLKKRSIMLRFFSENK